MEKRLGPRNHEFYSILSCGLVPTEAPANLGIADYSLLQKKAMFNRFPFRLVDILHGNYVICMQCSLCWYP